MQKMVNWLQEENKNLKEAVRKVLLLFVVIRDNKENKFKGER